jgi:TrmH family RNA methyltransferase
MATRDPITSTKNPLVKRVREIRDGRVDGLIVAEGVRLIEEALDAGLFAVQSLVSPRLYSSQRGTDLAARLAHASRESLDCGDKVLDRVSNLDTHQGVLAVFQRPAWSEDDLFAGESPFVLVAAGVRDPGNLGALVRTAEAAGASGLIALHGSADPYRDKALRGSSGSAFRLPCRSGVTVEQMLDIVERRGISVVASDSSGGVPLWDADFGAAPQAFLVGAEGAGLPQQLRDACTSLVRIPMQAPVESLNLAVAAGLLLFEHRRRIGFETPS